MKTLGRKTQLQSAMEYLMTYGWAILIIAVVLGALFQLGIFNASTFTPKAPPGSCHVFRPNGPGTSSFINTQGICNGELPQYVASFNGKGYVSITKSAPLNTLGNAGAITVSMWIYSSSRNSNGCNGIFGDWTDPSNGLQILSGNANGNCAGPLYFGNPGAAAPWPSGKTYLTQGSWEMVTAEYDSTSGVANLYLNNVLYASTTSSGKSLYNPSTPYYIGAHAWSLASELFYGYISNVQMYNKSFSQNDITALYNEGIGGAPIALSNLVGWWPLNGDAKDYSGNNGNGVTTAVTFTSNWEQGYSAP